MLRAPRPRKYPITERVFSVDASTGAPNGVRTARLPLSSDVHPQRSPEEGPRLRLIEAQHADVTEQVPSCWRKGGGAPQDFVVRTDHQVAWSGTSSLLISSLRSTGGHASVMQKSLADAWRDQRVEYSAMVRTRGVRLRANIWFRADDAHGRQIAFDQLTMSFDDDRQIKNALVERGNSGDSEWTRQRIVIDVPANAATISYGAFLHGEGSAWIDDLRIESVSSDVLTTSPARSPPDLRDLPLEDLSIVPKAPYNTDFEDAAELQSSCQATTASLNAM